jgi:hypothetical protein
MQCRGFCAFFRFTAVVLIAIQNVRSADTSTKAAEVQEVTVTGQATGSLTSGSSEESAKQKTQVPGAFTVKTANDRWRFL